MLQRVERHIIKKHNANFQAIDALSFNSKNLYNYTNYILRQNFIHGKKLPKENELVAKFRQRKNKDYYSLCGNVNQQCIKQLYKNRKSFFALTKDYKKNPNKYLGKPKMPKYKAKNGRNILIFTYMDSRVKEGYLYFNKFSNIEPIKTKVTNEQYKQTRIIPQANCYIVEITYEIEGEDCGLDKANYLSIDLGIDNLATCYDSHANTSFIVNGKIIKSINQYYNKKNAKLMSYIGDKGTSNRINTLTLKRNNKINNYLHHASKTIINYCITHNIGTIVIGHNKNRKQEADIGKVNNQKFVQIPFNKLIQQIQYKTENIGINCIITEESYTSKTDHLVLEDMCHHDTYLGKRIKRGLFRSSTNKVLNADLNGAIGILRKVIDESSFEKIVDRGFVINPVRVNPIVLLRTGVIR